MADQSLDSTIDNTDMLRPAALLASLPATMRLLVAVVLVFSSARLLVDGLGLQLMGRSLSQGRDFVAYYVGAAMLKDGYYLYDLELAHELSLGYTNDPNMLSSGYLYPPLLAILLVPTTLLSFSMAYKLWAIVQFVCLIAAIYVLAKNLPQLGKWAWPTLFVFAANMYPNYVSVDMGQVTIPLLLVFAFVSTLHAARSMSGWES